MDHSWNPTPRPAPPKPGETKPPPGYVTKVVLGHSRFIAYNGELIPVKGQKNPEYAALIAALDTGLLPKTTMDGVDCWDARAFVQFWIRFSKKIVFGAQTIAAYEDSCDRLQQENRELRHKVSIREWLAFACIGGLIGFIASLVIRLITRT